MIRNILLIIIIVSFSCVPPPTQNSSSINKDIAPLWNEGNAKWYKPANQSNPNIDFYDFLKGVNSVEIYYADRKPYEQQAEVIKNIAFSVRQYLHNIGFEYVVVTNKEQLLVAGAPRVCKKAYFGFHWNINTNEYNQSFITNLGFTFSDCKNNYFTLAHKDL